MAESEMGGERTEEPSQRRLQEARERGQLPRSRELTNFATMIGGSAALVAVGGTAASHLAQMMRRSLSFSGQTLRSTDAKFNLELALLADGVAPRDIYKALSTPQGVARALAKLGTLGPIMWWTRSSEPAAMLADGRAAFATILNGDIYNAAAQGGEPGIIWDHQLYELDVFGIPKGDPKREMAMDFIRFATAPENLAHVADWVPYGPARRSALALVTKNPELGTAMRRFLPTAPENFRNAFAIDDSWWRAHRAGVTASWQAWQSLRNR